MPKCDFNKFARNFIEIALRHGCSAVNLLIFSAHLFLGTPMDGCFCNALAKRSSFGESTFVLTQANSRKVQRTVKRNCNKRMNLISNLQIPIHFLLLLFVWHVNEMFFFFYVSNMRS